ncbi:hypothetical protein HOU03_gp417 [Caulobacter phage CcrSC]|uniref:Uncharacterized protein n=1 Tax=Caulobacter phage CcrSC TaxID=2283272 RepID=A0A385EDB0_9CAUD|nr:hypothetical protein HOU03_gp417 [Caulobacter phage CcrSC]AXQ69851.1 hypothetical protein CcrSC_gp269c [Caulobacter phage CcrSC]
MADLAALAARLTLNGAINLRRFITHPGVLNPDCPWGDTRIFTGCGKWTTLAAIGVENHLKALGVAEAVEGKRWHVITPLGRELAAYIHEHWDEIEFRP